MKSGPLAGAETEEKGRNGELCKELVAHSVEWTTGWGGNWGKGQELGALSGASGPLARSETKKRAENRELCLEPGRAQDNSFRKRQVVSKCARRKGALRPYLYM